MRVFMSSGDLSRTNSQKGARTTSALPTQVADMDQMSLQRTSVATYGYLGLGEQCGRRKSRERDALETVLALDLNLAGDICKEPVKNADAAKILCKAVVLRFALLQQVVLVEDGGEGRLLVYETLDGRGIVEAESARNLSRAQAKGRRDYLQNMAVVLNNQQVANPIYVTLSHANLLSTLR